MPAPSDLVYQQSTSTGTGNITLAAVNGRRTFVAAFGTGATTNVFTYFIAASFGSSYDEWEVGTGHMSNSTTLVRDTVIASSNANSAVDFSGGILDVTNDVIAANIVRNEGSTVADGNIVVFDGTTGRKLRSSNAPSTRLIPAGAVFFFAANAAPTGYLECNGSAVSRTTYADLFSAIGTTFGSGDGSTTFNLPDLRGKFLRGWDHGAGVDSGRSFGSAQADAFQSHRHGSTINVGGTAGSPFTGFVLGNTSASQSLPGTGVTGPTTDGAYGTPSVDTETRPKNVALLPCIAY